MTSPARPSAWLRARARVDRALGVVVSLVVAPVVGVLALLVRRQDGGPGLITVDRVGAGGRVFKMWKIRSMRMADPSGAAGGIALTSSADDRITPLGRRLRALHLDELPQIFNVARGDMLLLGPRPEAPVWVLPDDRNWDDVLAVPPGVAGPTQLIVGDWETTLIDEAPDGQVYLTDVVPVKQAVDAWYVRAAGPRLDLLVLVSLVTSVALDRAPVALERLVRAAVPAAARPIDWSESQR